MNKITYTLASCMVIIFLSLSLVSAQTDFTVTVGQNRTFTEFNGHSTFFGNSPGYTLPFPEPREANSLGNTAHVSLSAGEGHEGIALAKIGVNITWNMEGHTWEEIKNWPVKITFNYHYNIVSNWVQGNGSANAWIQSISPDGNSLDIYQQIGHLVGQSGTKDGEATESLNTYLSVIGDRIWIDAFCEAGSFGSSTHIASATLQLHNITIEFQKRKLNILGYSTDSPKYCLGDPVGFSCKIRDGSGNEILADQVTADISKPDNSKTTIGLEYNSASHFYRGEFRTASNDGNYDNEVGIYKAIIHAEKAGYVPSTSGELEFEVKPTELRGKVYDIIIGHGLGVLPKIVPARVAQVYIRSIDSNKIIKSLPTDSQGQFSVTLKPGNYRVSATVGIKESTDYKEQTIYVSPCKNKEMVIPAIIPQVEEAIKEAKDQAALDYNTLNGIRLRYIEEGENIGKLGNSANVAGMIMDTREVLHTIVALLAGSTAFPVVVISLYADFLAEYFVKEFWHDAWQKQLKAIEDSMDLLRSIVDDPPDSNYTEVIKPTMLEPLVLPPDCNDSANRTIAKLIDAQANQSAIGKALLMSFERYQAALNSGDTAYIGRQAQAITFYAGMLRENELEMKNATENAKAELESVRADVEANLTAFQMNLSSRNLTSEELLYLRSHNLTDQKINATIQLILDLNYSKTIGDLNDFQVMTSNRVKTADDMSNQSSKMLDLLNEPKGCYIGAYQGCSPQDLSCETMIAFNKKMGKPHAVFRRYVDIKASENQSHFDWAGRVKSNGAMPMFIFSPIDGLNAINMTQVQHFASKCNNLNIPIFVSFGEQMNGPWVPWGDRPDSYRAKFKEVAEVFHRIAPNVKMCWVPYQNYGYPWGAVNYGDGYSEYYPEGLGTYGEYVDWVGLDFFYKDWNETNSIPERLFLGGIRHGQGNIDFYQNFSVEKNKPMMIAETGVFDPNNDPTAPGVRVPVNSSAQAVFKNAWIKQVYNVSMLKNDLPNLKAICYFDTDRIEHEETQTHNFGNIEMDYRIPDGSYRDLIKDPYFIGAFAPSAPLGPSSSSPGTTCGYSTSLNDPEGDPIAYTFDWGDGTFTATGLISPGTIVTEAHFWNRTGTYEVRALATDIKGASSGWSNPLTVIVNSPPGTPSIPSGFAMGYAWVPYSYFTSATDPDGDQVNYNFDWGDKTISSSSLVNSGANVSLAHSWSNAGTYLITTNATDNKSAPSGWSNALAVMIAANSPPKTPSTPSGSASGYAWVPYSYSMSATDPDGNQVRYTLDWGDGTTSVTGLVNSGTSTSLAHNWTKAGTYQVKSNAMDSRGVPSGWSNALAITIAANSPPNTPSIPSGSSKGTHGTSYSYSTTATDPDGNQVKYTFDWGDGTTSTTGLVNSNIKASKSHTWSKAGTFQVKAITTDSRGATSGWSSALSVKMS